MILMEIISGAIRVAGVGLGAGVTGRTSTTRCQRGSGCDPGGSSSETTRILPDHAPEHQLLDDVHECADVRQEIQVSDLVGVDCGGETWLGDAADVFVEVAPGQVVVGVVAPVAGYGSAAPDEYGQIVLG
jgi:hypothetical protein